MSDDNLQPVNSGSEVSPQPRLYTEDELNREIDKVVGRKKAETAEKVSRETTERVTRELEEKYRSQAQVGNTAPINEDAIVNKVTSALQQQFLERQKKEESARHQALVEKSAESYVNHVQKVSLPPEEDKSKFLHIPIDGSQDEYADLKLMIGEFNLENTPEILEEIARKPRKLNDLSSAAEKGKKNLVNAMLKEISDSIQERKDSLNSRPNIKAPVSSLKPSTSSSSSRPMTLNDWKNASTWKNIR